MSIDVTFLAVHAGHDPRDVSPYIRLSECRDNGDDRIVVQDISVPTRATGLQ